MGEQRYLQVDDYEPVAKEKLPPDVYDYYAGGAGDERTLEENLRAFDRWVLRPRFLRASGFPDTSTELLGTRIEFPVLVAPWAYQGRAHPDGERGTVRGAARAGTIAVVSSTAVDDLERIAEASDGPKWWQLYLFADPGLNEEMLARVVSAGYEAICWTVDFPVGGLRHRDTRSGFVMPFGIGDADHVYEPDMTWDHLAFIREHAPGLPVLVKGILTAEDALLAVEHRADGIVVSNHGGRQLDSCPASLDALPEVVKAVAGRSPVLMDGGVRRGTDVLKAVALGAAAVMVGRPAAWGLAAEGEDGVAGVLGILRAEVENAMALTGCRSVAEIGRELVAPAP
jgi:4-hydroxymandelate oxidase